MNFENLEKKIGNTPLIQTEIGGVFAKIEGENPAGSIKDRAAFFMLKKAYREGKLKSDTIVIEATSGNTGIGLAYCAKQLGLKTVLTMPDSMSLERRKMLQDYGAELILTPAKQGMQGAVDKAIEIEKETHGFYARQFENSGNSDAHFLTTAPEIFSQLADVKCIVAGIGSSGTVVGISKYIKENKKDCMVVGVEPSSSPLLTKGYAGAHKIQGIGANFVPKLFDKNAVDEILTVEDDDAFEMLKWFFKTTGKKVGISSGAALSAAKKMREKIDGKIVVILPDNGDRYSQELYEVETK